MHLAIASNTTRRLINMARVHLQEDRLFSADPANRAIARRLYAGVRHLSIINSHGHTNPSWFAENQPLTNPSALLNTPDHYVFRMLYSQAIPQMTVPRSASTRAHSSQARHCILCFDPVSPGEFHQIAPEKPLHFIC